MTVLRRLRVLLFGLGVLLIGFVAGQMTSRWTSFGLGVSEPMGQTLTCLKSARICVGMSAQEAFAPANLTELSEHLVLAYCPNGAEGDRGLAVDKMLVSGCGGADYVAVFIKEPPFPRSGQMVSVTVRGGVVRRIAVTPSRTHGRASGVYSSQDLRISR